MNQPTPPPSGWPPPPGWPPHPPGPPGWPPHPGWPPQYGHYDRRPRLDRAMAAMRAADPAPWGWRPVIIPIAALIGLILAGSVVTRLIRPDTTDGKLALAIVGNVALEGLLAAAVWWGGRDIAARYGGWGAAFGWRRPVWKDLQYAAAGLGVAFGLRIVVGVVANGLTHDRATRESQNVHLNSVSIAAILLLVFVTVLCAPLIEETMFRGLLLRTFMRRWGFWPAAVCSTVIFGGFHTYEVATLTGALTLAAAVGSMGLVNCVLVRLSDRLVPGIFVHATLNGLALVVLVAQAHG